MKRLFIALVASLFVLSGLVAPQAATASDTSKYGEQAIEDLVTCLNDAKSLDVFYLVDSSLSLKDTDPKNELAKIIFEDIERWADIGVKRPEIKIQVAGALFSSSTARIADWQDLNADNATSVAEKFAKQINNGNLSNFTNWRAGLEEAFDQHKTRSSDCKVVIWFTDGGLWSAPWNTADRPKSLDDLEALCGPANKGDVTRSASSEGIMAQMRSAGIRVFGILLNVGVGNEKKDEAFYRSLMQPVIEEKGQVSSGSGLPSGEITCGENLPAEERDYATGAFLEAQSAADVAYKLLDVSIIDSTKEECEENGDFWVDPGIDSVEFATDASSWQITDSKGVVKKRSAGSRDITTGPVKIPEIKEPEKWNFKTVDAKICALYVFPEIYMSLHDKSLISGKQGSITGQFVKSLTSNRIADLSIYKSVEFSAKIDGKPFVSTLNEKTGTFEIKGFTPPASSDSAKVQATLKLKTAHYDLKTLNLDKSKEVYSAGVLPEVSSIKFVSDLVGAKGKAIAEVTIKAPAAQGVSSSVCFDDPQVISDGQDESAGRATDRSQDWEWKLVGVDANNCIDFLNGTNRDQKVTFELSNPTQANAQGEALFNYKISSGDIADLKDSQTAGFGTQAETNSWLFWFWFVVLLFAGLAIPFGILRYINSKNARFTVGPGTFRGVIGLRLDRENQRLLVNTENGSLTDAKANWIFRPVSDNLAGSKTYEDGPVSLKAKSPLWPLAEPQFLAALATSATLLAGELRTSGYFDKDQRLAFGRVSSLAYVTTDFSDDIREDLKHFEPGSIAGLVVFLTNPDQDPYLYKERIDEFLKDADLFEALSQIIPEPYVAAQGASGLPEWTDLDTKPGGTSADDDWFHNADSGFTTDSKAKDDF
jgi:hypothetical protein